MASDGETVSLAFGLGMVRALKLGMETLVSLAAPFALDALGRSSDAEMASVAGKHSVRANKAFASAPSWMRSYCIPLDIRLVAPFGRKKKKNY